jgi:CheY-like chemotaxis protein
VANNGAEALERVDTRAYDGVLMDCQMPVLDGFEATRRIRQDGRFADLPILAMTANAMAGDKERCIEAGMNDHIAKPIDVAQLFLTLARWVKPGPDAGMLQAPSLEPAADGLPVIPALDLHGALSRVGGSVKLLRKLIGRFVQTQADVIQRIEAARAQADRETALREAHTLKGLAGNIGAVALGRLAGQLEVLLKQEATEGVEPALEVLEAELVSLLAAISAAMGVEEPAPAPVSHMAADAVDQDKLLADLRKLTVLLEDLDAGSGTFVEGLMERLSALGQAAEARNILALVSDFEFDDALERVKAMAQAMNLAL